MDAPAVWYRDHVGGVAVSELGAPVSVAHYRQVLTREIHDLEFDPQTQWKFHRKMCRFWLANYPLIIFLQVWGFAGGHWAAVYVGVALLFLNTLYSLYANLVTEFDGVHSAYAAWKADEIRAAESKITNDQLAVLLNDVLEVVREL